MKQLALIFFLVSTFIANAQVDPTNSQKLIATCKVWGFLKYFHTEVASGKYKWDEQLFAILPKIENAKSNNDFSLVLEKWIDVLGKVKKIALIKNSDTISYFNKNSDLKWLNKNKLFSKNLSEKLLFIKENRWQGKQFYVYTTIDKDEYSTDGIHLQNEIHYSDYKWDNRNLRLLTFFRFWNIIKYLFG